VTQILTLHLGARNRHVDIFALWLEPGAQIEESVEWTAISPRIMRRLSANTLLIGRLLKAGFGSQLNERPGLGIFLASAVQSGASTNVVRQLLDNGTDARQLFV
jgi:hypothetical protein